MRLWRMEMLAALALTAGCGLINVNGKPLGGGGKKADDSSASGGGGTYDENVARQGERNQVARDGSGRPKLCTDYSYSEHKDFGQEDFPPDGQYERVYAEAMCATRGEKFEMKAKFEASRQEWMKANGYDELDFEIAVGQAKGYSDESQDFEKMSGPQNQIAFKYVSELMDDMDRRGAHASQLGKYNLIAKCFAVSGGSDSVRTTSWTETPLLQEILCTRVDVSLAKAYAEIESVKELNAGSRYRLRRMVFAGDYAYQQAAADVAKRAKEDPGIAQLVKIADAQKAEWMTPPPARAKLIASVDAMETATATNKRSAFAGCEATTKAAWDANIKAGKWPKVPSEHLLGTWLPIAFSTPDGYLAFHAWELCAAGSDKDLRAVSAGLDFMGSDTKRRGFFSATLAAWLAASGDIKFDSRDLDMQQLLGGGRYNDSLSLREGYRNQRILKGQIEKLEPQKDGTVKITYKHASIVIDDCVKWRNTNRIQSISSSGQLTYESQCTAWGKVKLDVTADPSTASAAVVDGLKAGMFLYFIEGGFPVAATASSSSSKPVWVMGTTL